jgi:hypothetical protein
MYQVVCYGGTGLEATKVARYVRVVGGAHATVVSIPQWHVTVVSIPQRYVWGKLPLWHVRVPGVAKTPQW